jgi:hypothetical protein
MAGRPKSAGQKASLVLRVDVELADARKEKARSEGLSTNAFLYSTILGVMDGAGPLSDITNSNSDAVGALSDITLGSNGNKVISLNTPHELDDCTQVVRNAISDGVLEPGHVIPPSMLSKLEGGPRHLTVARTSRSATVTPMWKKKASKE